MARHRGRPDARTATAVRARGFALLIVLWTMVLLTLLVTQLVSAGRSETEIAGNLRRSAILQAAADGGVQAGIFNALARRWAADDAPHAIRVGGAVVTVRVMDLAGRINPNYAPQPLMQALLRELGLDQQRAAAVAAAMADWRTRTTVPRQGGAKTPQYRAAGLDWGPAGRPFESIDEIGLVLGMTPDLLARLRPFLSIYKEGDVQRNIASPLTTEALDDAVAQGNGLVLPQFTSGNLVAQVTAVATEPGGGVFTRQVTMRAKGQPGQGDPLFQILTWHGG